MIKEKTQQNTNDKCKDGGLYIPLSKVDGEKINTMLNIALIDLESIKEFEKIAEKNSGKWNIIYKTYYDILHQLSEAYMLFDKIKARTHECLFCYICDNHKELELDWNFFEKIRTKRNGTTYYGQILTYKDFKEIDIQIKLYINTIKKAIEEKLK